MIAQNADMIVFLITASAESSITQVPYAISLASAIQADSVTLATLPPTGL